MKEFGELTRDEQLELMTAWVDGATIEVLDEEKWRIIDHPCWVGSMKYRNALKPDSIDWSHVAPEFKYMARDESGHVCLYEREPVLSDGYVWGGSGDYIRAMVFASLKVGTVDWKDSLVERP